MEDTVAAVRALRVPPAGVKSPGAAVGDLRWVLSELGHAPLGWHPPNGYPDVAPAWSSASSTLGRWNLHVGLAAGWWAGRGLARPDWKALVGAPATAGELLDALGRALLCQPLGADVTQALLDFLGCAPGDPPPEAALLPVLAALVLDSPAFALR